MKFWKQIAWSLGTAAVAFGVMFSLLPPWIAMTLIALILIHEFAHYFSAKYLHLNAALPFFIPLGYFAVAGVYIEEDVTDLQGLLIALAGPLAGILFLSSLAILGLYFGSLPVLGVSLFLLLGEFFNLTIGFDSVKIRKGIKFIRNNP